MSEINLQHAVDKICFRGQMQDEVVLSFTRKHWISLIPEFASLILYLAIMSLCLSLIGEFTVPLGDEILLQSLIVLVLVGTGFVIHRFFVHLINYFLTVIIFTNMRIVEVNKTVFLHENLESIDTRMIEDVQISQDGLIKNFLKCGDLHIILGTGELRPIDNIPNPGFFFRLVNRVKNEHYK